MKYVYIIRYEELSDSGEYFSGVSYVFDTLEKVEIMLEEIKKDEKCGNENVDIHELLTENGFIAEYNFNDAYTKYIIEEIEVQ